jgi:hypothetical protein
VTGLGLRATNNVLHIIQSSVETFATLLLIVIRMTNAYTGYREVRKTIQHVNHYDPGENIHIRLIRFWMRMELMAGACLVGVCVGCFVIFYFFVHLGWTIRSNNFCLITITVLSGLYAARVGIAVRQISEDLHKVKKYKTAPEGLAEYLADRPQCLSETFKVTLSRILRKMGCLRLLIV